MKVETDSVIWTRMLNYNIHVCLTEVIYRSAKFSRKFTGKNVFAKLTVRKKLTTK